MSDDPINKHIGKRLALARARHEKTLQSVAEDLGLSYQQLRKYETGINRVSASTLFRLADILAVPPAFFFDGLKPSRKIDVPPPELIDGLERIDDDEVRERIRALVQALAQ